MGGLLRRPRFVAGESTVKAAAANAWQWAEEAKVARLQLHQLSYRGFKRGEFKSSEVAERLAQVAAGKDEQGETYATISTAMSASFGDVSKTG